MKADKKMPTGCNRQALTANPQSSQMIKKSAAYIIPCFCGDFKRTEERNMLATETKTNTPLMLGVNETAEKFGIARHYARQLALSGAVKAVRVGKNKILINYQSVCDFFNSSYLQQSEPKAAAGIQPIPVKL